MKEPTVIEEMLEKIRDGKIRSEDQIRGRSVTRHKKKHLDINSYGKSPKKAQKKPKLSARRVPVMTYEEEDIRTDKPLPFKEVYEKTEAVGSWVGMPRPLFRTDV
jgi:hypothetical protein